MADRHDTVALAWVKGAIDDSLGLARQALEQFAGEPGDTSTLLGVIELLHQVHGCLVMLELNGAALLASEMEQLAQALREGQANPRGEALGALFRGLEQLPMYLERLRSARRDLPLVALPLLNQLRVARGAEAQVNLLDAGAADQLVPAAAELANLDRSLGALRDQLHAGPDRDAMRSVVAALRDDLVRIKERLDLFVRGNRDQVDELDTLLAPLRQIADTLAVLGFAQPRRVILDQVAVLHGLAQGQRAPEDALLMDVAGALLYVEATLGGMVGSMETVNQSPLPGTDLAEIRQLVLDECHGVLLQAKDLIADCLEAGWDRQRLQSLPALLNQIRGALAMLMLPRPAALLLRCHDFAQRHLLYAEGLPDGLALDHYADAICSLEIYLQGMSVDPQADFDSLLLRAEAALAALGFPTLPAPVIEPKVEALEDAPLDDELREIFLEEAEEVLQQLDEHWTRWRADTRLREALVELRRGFHTLKGSGRMVRAHVLGELAWAAEHLLNRMLEGRVEAGPDVFDGLEQALVLLPPLLLEFAAARVQPHAEVERLASHLHALAMSDPSAASTPSDAIDPQLLEIFRNEAHSHLATLDEFLLGAEEHLPLPVSDNLQRALHTLKGSAAMAGVTAIAELASALDLLAREFKAHQLGFDLDEIYLLQMAEPLLRRGLEQMGATPQAAISGADILIEQVDQVVSARLQALHDAPAQGLRIKRDPQLIASFLAQGMDILLDAESLLLRWQEHPGERQELTALLDELTTLGQSAHLADLWQVDELCEALLDLYGAVEESSLAVSERFFREAQQAHEALIDMLDQIAAGQEVDPCPERLQALRDLLGESLDPSAVGLVRSQGAQPLSITELAAATRELAQPAPDREMELLFLEEAVDILENADQALARWLEEPDNASALSSLQRELDTLMGGAQMAGIGSIEVLSQELEILYAGLVDRRYSLSPALATLLKGSHQLLARLLGQLQRDEAPSTVVEQLAVLREFRHNAAPAVQEKATIAPAQEADKELLEIFLEEGFDIVESTGAALIRWQAEPRNTVEVENLLRDLHTLKGGARMVEIAPIGDLAHELEFLYEHLAAGQLQPSSALFSLLQNCHDRLAHMLDAVRLHQPLHAATALIDYIRNFSSAALSDTAAAVPSNESALPEALTPAPERAPADMVKVAAELLDDLGNLAGEDSIIRGRIEQQVNDAQVALNEMETTLERMRDQLRRLDTETQGRILSRQQSEGDALGYDDFDPLEMDRHSQLQQLSRALFESASDLLDLKETLSVRTHDAHSLLQQQARVNSELQEGLMRTRMVPFERLVPRLQRVVRQVASELGKQVELVVGNAEGEMDRSVLERMVAPLEHMLRNAVDHGMESREGRLKAGKPEQGMIALNLLHEGADIVIEMSDDGAGVPLEAVRSKAIKRGLLDPASELSDYEVMQFILQPGFSTAEKITQISGRGLGMDVVHEEVKQLGGSMVIDSVPGKGARFLIRLPFTVSVNRALMVHYADEQYAVPLNTIEGVVRVLPAELEACYQLDPPRYEYAGHRYELRYLGQMLQGEAQPRLLGQSLPLPVLLVHAHDQSFAVQVDSLTASREIVVKSLGPQFAAVQGLAGATLLGDGRVVLILDLLTQLRSLHLRLSQQGKAARLRGDEPGSGPARPLLVLVVDDSVTVRKVTGRLLERHGMNVLTAKDGVDAMAVLEEHRPDVMLLDIEMPRMDGFEVATQVRQDPQLKDLPIIMITSRTGQKHRDRAMAIGVNDYLGKPYHESVLLESIARWSTSHA